MFGQQWVWSGMRRASRLSLLSWSPSSSVPPPLPTDRYWSARIQTLTSDSSISFTSIVFLLAFKHSSNLIQIFLSYMFSCSLLGLSARTSLVQINLHDNDYKT